MGSEDQATAGPSERMTRAQRGALASLSLAQFTTTLEFTVVFLALPSLVRAVRLDPAAVPWVAGAYAVAFGGLLIVGGRLVDRAGARGLFLLAVAGFAAASVVGALANGASMLLTARAAQGVAAALLQPAVLALMQARFPREPVRGRAWAWWAGVGATGLGAGALLGGLLAALSWRLTFAVNVPLMAGCALGALRWIARDPPRVAPARVPVIAAVLVTGATVAVALSLTLVADHGWTTSTWICLATAVVLAAGFVARERGPWPPMIDPVLRRVATLRVGIGATSLYMASAGSVYYLLTLLLQNVWSYAPSHAGLAFLPLAVMVAVGSSAAPRIAARLGQPVTLAAGFGLAAVGLGGLAVTAPVFSYWWLLVGLLVGGMGNGIVFTVMFALGTRDVPAAHHGTAGGVLATAQYLASTIALAALAPVLGRAPEPVDYRTAFWLLTATAALGALLALAARRASDGSGY